MKKEYKILTFKNNPSGIKAKQLEILAYRNDGWIIESETLQGERFNGPAACCFSIICFPLAFLGFQTQTIEVQLYREIGLEELHEE